MAGGLVKAYEGHRFVFLHLLCQGLENIGKAMLLARDHDKYGPMLRPVYGHNLVSLLAELKVAYGRDIFSPEATVEIVSLNVFYKQHQLRYGDTVDFTSDFSALNADCLHSELVGLLGELNDEFARSAFS